MDTHGRKNWRYLGNAKKGKPRSSHRYAGGWARGEEVTVSGKGLASERDGTAGLHILKDEVGAY